MQFIFRKKMKLRRAINSFRSYLPFHSKLPQQLTIRWGDSDLKGLLGIGDELAHGRFEVLISDFVNYCGINPVHILAYEHGGEPQVSTLLKFAHRLDCPTKVVLNGDGITSQAASSLIHSGVDEICLVVGGLSSKLHHEVTGCDIDETTKAINLLLNARDGFSTKITIVLPWVNGVPREYPAVSDWAKEIGVDQVRPEVPFYGADLSEEEIPNQPRLNSILRRLKAETKRVPGWKKHSRLPCPIGVTRLEVSKNGRICSCPFKRPENWDKEDFNDLWNKLDHHRQEIRNCPRECWHSELQYRRET
jgi:hypothetical protein